MDEQLRLGFIGGGINSAVGTTHFIAAQMDGLFRVDAGCFSRHADVNAQTAARWGVAAERCYVRWEEMLERERDQLDAIVILTPTPTHRDPVISALQAGFEVICEKALATTASEAAEIEKTVDATKRFLTVTYNYTGYPMVRELREMIREGRLGRVEQIHLEMPQEGFARLNRDGQPVIPQQWRLEDGVIPSISLDLGVHLHHLVDFLTGEKPLEVVASQSSLGRFREVVDNTMALIRYTNDLESNFWFSKAALGYRNGLRVRVFGEDGSAEWVQMNPEMLHFADNRGQQIRIDRANCEVQVAQLDRYNRFKSGHPAGFLEAFANLYKDIAESLARDRRDGDRYSDYVFSARHAREGLVLLEAIDRSAREGQWVSLDLESSV